MQKNYNIVTKEWLGNATPNSHPVLDQLFYDYNGVRYLVDGKKVVLDYSKKEREVAEWLKNTFGGEIKMIPKVNIPEGIKTPDYIFRGESWDLKIPKGSGKRTIEDLLKRNRKQSKNFIIDISFMKNKDDDIRKQIIKLFNSKTTNWIYKIIIKRQENLICVLENNKKEIGRNPTGHDQFH